MLTGLAENVNNMQEHIGNRSRKMETLRKSQKEMLRIKIIVIKMKTAFDRLLSKWDTEEERIHEHGKVSTETSNRNFQH